MNPVPQGIPPLRPDINHLNPFPETSHITPDSGKQSFDTDQPSSSETHKDQKEHDPPAEKTPEALKHAQAFKLATWVKQSSSLLQQLENKKTPAQRKPKSNEIDGSIVEDAGIDEAKGFEEGELIQQGIDEAQLLAERTISSVGTVKLLGADMDMAAVSGLSYASTVGKELIAGINLLGSKWKLNTLKLEREAIVQQLQEIFQQLEKLPVDQQDQYDLAVTELTRQKIQVDAQIKKMEESDWKKAFTFLATHMESSISSILTVLGHSHDQAAVIVASGGGTGIGAIGMVASTGGIIKGILNYTKLDDQMVDIIKVSEKHENSNISKAIAAVKTIALDHTASHQRSNIFLGVFQNAFTFCQSGISVAMSIITAVALGAIGTAAGAGAISAAAGLAPGIPVVTGIGLLIAGAVAIYNNRHTLGRGLKELRAGNYNLERNLTFRQWKRQSEFKFITKKMLKLGEQHAKLVAGTASNKTSTEKALEVISANDGSFYSMVSSVARASAVLMKAGFSNLEARIDESLFGRENRNVFRVDKGNIEEVDKAIKELALRFFDLKDELEKIDSKLEGQRLRDETGDIANSNITTAKAIDAAIKDLEVRIANIDDATAQLYHFEIKIAEAAYKKLKAKQIKLAEKSEKELDKRYEALLNPSESTKENVRTIFSKKIEEKTDKLRLLDRGQKNDKAVLEAEAANILKAEITELEGYNSNDGATGLEFEINRISDMRTKVKADLAIMRKPGREDFHGLAEIFNRRRDELVENIEVLKAKATQVENQDSPGVESEELEEGLLTQAGMKPKAMDSSQERLLEALQALGEGDELREFAAVFEKMGVSFEDIDSRQYKNLYVQTQIQKAITSQTIVWK